jgi:hypothetical protein
VNANPAGIADLFLVKEAQDRTVADTLSLLRRLVWVTAGNRQANGAKKEKYFRALWIAAEFSRFADIFGIKFIDHNRYHAGIDTECCYQGIRELLYNGTFLFRGKSLSHFDDDNGHGYTFFSMISGEKE